MYWGILAPLSVSDAKRGWELHCAYKAPAERLARKLAGLLSLQGNRSVDHGRGSHGGEGTTSPPQIRKYPTERQ